MGSVVMQVKRSLVAQLTRPRATPSKPLASDRNLKLAARHRDGKTWLDCASFGGQDGLDLVLKCDDIVAACDRREVTNVVDFFNKGFLVAAHEADHLAETGDPAKITEYIPS